MKSIPKELQLILVSTPETAGGNVRFRNTRIPVKLLFDFVLGGEGLDEFLAEFPDVQREDAQAVLDWEHKQVVKSFSLETAA